MSVRRGSHVVLASLGALAMSAPGWACGSSRKSSTAPAAPASATSSTATMPATGAVSITTGDFLFSPKEVHVATGATVSWTNHGSTTHTVEGPGFFSQALDPGKTYTHRFLKSGRYPYLCTLHPTLMRGVIVVS